MKHAIARSLNCLKISKELPKENYGPRSVLVFGLVFTARTRGGFIHPRAAPPLTIRDISFDVCDESTAEVLGISTELRRLVNEELWHGEFSI